MNHAKTILDTYLHVQNDGRTVEMPVSDAFWEELARGAHSQLDEGRLMSAFTFSAPWATWERHPAGEELVMLLTGSATVLLEQSGAHRSVHLTAPGSFVLVPQNVWHTAKTNVPTTMLFLTRGADTEHRAVA